MKNIAASLLILAILVGTTGVAVQKHYCGHQETVLSEQAHCDCCTAEGHCSMEKENKQNEELEDCSCSDTFKFDKIDTPFLASEKSLKLIKFKASENKTFKLHEILEAKYEEAEKFVRQKIIKPIRPVTKIIRLINIFSQNKDSESSPAYVSL